MNGKFRPTASLLCLTLALVLFSVFLCPAQAAELESVTLTVAYGVNLYVDDVSFTPTDVNGKAVFPFIWEGTTYLPIRAVATIFRADIYWDQDTASVRLTRSEVDTLKNGTPAKADTPLTYSSVIANKGISLYVDSVARNLTNANGDMVEIFLIDGTTYLPLRAIAGLFNAEIAWEQGNHGVYIGKHVSVVELPAFAFANSTETLQQMMERINTATPAYRPGYLTNGKPATDENVKAMLADIKKSMPAGCVWNSDERYSYYMKERNCYAIECASFAEAVSDYMYGEDAPVYYYNMDSVYASRPGDVMYLLRVIEPPYYSLMHWVVITDTDGDMVKTGSGNYSGKVNWDNSSFKLATLQQSNFSESLLVTRNPIAGINPLY